MNRKRKRRENKRKSKGKINKQDEIEPM